MDSAELITQIQDCLKQVADLRNERQAIASPKVKAWKTEVERLLRLGGKNTSKLLQNFQNLRFGASAMGADVLSSSDVKFQAYQAELDTAEKILKNTVQTIQIFGVSEEQKLPDWFKAELKASGMIRLGGREVDIKTITIDEFLNALLTLSESDKSLDETIKNELAAQINKVRKHSLLSPFLNQSLDKVFSKI
jgi:hypothetical protein